MVKLRIYDKSTTSSSPTGSSTSSLMPPIRYFLLSIVSRVYKIYQLILSCQIIDIEYTEDWFLPMVDISLRAPFVTVPLHPPLTGYVQPHSPALLRLPLYRDPHQPGHRLTRGVTPVEGPSVLGQDGKVLHSHRWADVACG